MEPKEEKLLCFTAGAPASLVSSVADGNRVAARTGQMKLNLNFTLNPMIQPQFTDGAVRLVAHSNSLQPDPPSTQILFNCFCCGFC